MSARAKVLVVEDDHPLRHFYRTVLSMAGFEVSEARSGYEALQSIGSDPPGIIVLDLGLPGFSGLTVLEDLAAQAHTRHIPVVIVTGQTGPAIEHLDADCLLTKPISADQLVGAVRKCLASGAGNTER